MKNLSREKQQEGIAAYRDLFQKDYEQRIMKELTENSLLNQLITQEDAKLYISLNGKKYDLESYISNRAKYYTTNVATQIERAVDKEQGWTIFRFVRIEDVKVERPHSVHDNEHNDDYFTTDESLIGQKYDGKILLDAYKAIEDYPYGEQPPFGCRHVWVGVAKGIEDKPEEAKTKEDIEKDFVVGQSVGAMAKEFKVDMPTDIKSKDGENWKIVGGSTVKGVKVIAEGEEIRDVQRLVKENPLSKNHLTKAKDWSKVRATAKITNGEYTDFAEIHYYFCPNVGKIEFKFKKWQNPNKK
ncbi:MAG: hypothetical protein IKP67_00770 [Spirochaetales bacterium]|nr:hypothetical protein [Spirochaetales bacterium]